MKYILKAQIIHLFILAFALQVSSQKSGESSPGPVFEQMGAVYDVFDAEDIPNNDQIDRIFEKMFIAGNLDTPGMGIMYVTPLEKAATYIPQEIIDRLAQPVVGAEQNR